MPIKIAYSFLPYTDYEKTLDFYRDKLGFEVRKDVAMGDMHWITFGQPDQPEMAFVIEPPAMDPSLTDAEKQTISELMAKGSYARATLSTDDLDGLFAKLEAAGVEVVQEPTDQPYGVRDCAIRDPAGNLIRINQQ